MADGAARRGVDPRVLPAVAGEPDGVRLDAGVPERLPAGVAVHATGGPVDGGAAEPGVRAFARYGTAAVAAGIARDAARTWGVGAAGTAQGGVGEFPGSAGWAEELGSAVGGDAGSRPDSGEAD